LNFGEYGDAVGGVLICGQPSVFTTTPGSPGVEA
jgi:hypothetical protein